MPNLQTAKIKQYYCLYCIILYTSAKEILAPHTNTSGVSGGGRGKNMGQWGSVVQTQSSVVRSEPHKVTEEELFGRTNFENPTDAFMQVVNGSPGGDLCLAYIPVGPPICPVKLIMIKKYLFSGMESSFFPFEVESIIELENNSQWEELPPEPASDFHMLLWHGTDLNGARGIMSTEFRMPPSSQARHLLYGNGIYFSDRVDKCLCYCTRYRYPSPGQIGYLCLCRVNVGNLFVVRGGLLNGYSELPDGYHSIKAEGHYIPDPNDHEIDKDTVIPLGRTIQNPDYSRCYTWYNEYVVYDPTRIDIQYLLKIRFF